MIDSDGYRQNVGIIICNRSGQVLWARRRGQNSWQFPQGGINQGETAEQAMFRELHEEVGLAPKDVKILAVTGGWLRYKLPKRMIRWGNEPVCIGQKQKWFLLELVNTNESAIRLDLSDTPEFDDWRWVNYWYPIRQVIAFKREVYRRAMKEFSSPVFAIQKLPETTVLSNSMIIEKITTNQASIKKINTTEKSTSENPNHNRSKSTRKKRSGFFGRRNRDKNKKNNGTANIINTNNSEF